MAAQGNKLVLFCLLLAVAQRVTGQDLLIGNLRPCQDPAADPDPNNPEDNLSCPRLDTTLQCYPLSQLCNGVENCAGGSDEGTDLVALECNNQAFACSPGETVPLTALCDGNRDCTGGDDETTTLCENKCLLPYYGGCPASRVCITSEFDVNCGDCLPGFFDDPNPPPNVETPPCLIGIRIEQPAYVVQEDAGTLEVCAVLIPLNGTVVPIQLPNGSSRDVQIGLDVFFNLNPTVTAILSTQQSTGPLAATGGSPVGVDYTDTTMGISFTISQIRDCITIPITSDVVLDDMETFGVTLTSTSPNAAIVQVISSAVVTIQDPTIAATVGLQTLVFNQVEGDVTFQACVEILQTTNSAPLSEVLQATVSTSPNTATANADYSTALTPSTLVLSAGAVIGNSQCFDVTILSDNLVEGPENFFLNLVSANQLLTVDSTRQQATVNINDDDVAIFVLDMSSYTVMENQGPQVVFAELQSGVLATDVVVTVQTIVSAQATATAGSDYTVSSADLTFTAANIVGSSMSLSIPIINDDTLEGTESFFVQLSIAPASTSLAAAGTPSLAPVNILDNDAIPVTLSLVSASVLESDGFVTAQVMPTMAPPTDFVLTVFTSPITATDINPADYTGTTVTLTFPAGLTNSQTVNIPINNDLFVEPDETFNVLASSMDQRVMITGSPAMATIIDDDTIFYEFTQTQYSVDESMGPLQAAIRLAANSGTPLAPFTVLISTDDGTATATSDYVGLTSTTVVFPAMSVAGTTQGFTVTIIDDSVVEPDEVFTLSSSDNNPRATNLQSTALGLITDDDDPVVGFDPTIYNAVEGMPGQLEICVVLLSLGILSQPVPVQISTSDGSATAPMDYFSVVGRTLTFPTGSVQGSSQCTNINIVNDNFLEPDIESFFADLTTDPNIAQVDPTRSQATINIQDRDEVIFDIQNPSYVFPEANAMRPVCVEIAQGSAQLSSDTLVSFQSGPGTATAGAGGDYLPFSVTLTFPANSGPGSSQCTLVQILDDDTVEDDETFPITAVLVTPNPDIMVRQGSGTVTITDDDMVTIGLVPPPNVGTPLYTVPEDADIAVVCVEIESGTLAPGISASVTFNTANNVAVAPDDYTAVTMALTFNVGNMDQMMCIQIPIIDDILCEGNEPFQVNLVNNNPTNVNLAPGRQSGTVTIIDDDTAQVGLRFLPPTETGTVTECADEAVVAQLSLVTNVRKAPARSCTIFYQTSDNTATAGEDYEQQSGSCTFSNTVESCDISITILDDFISYGEMDETFNILLQTNNPDACQIVNDNITVTIIDDEDCPREPCGEFERCIELPCPDNFTCEAIEAVGDDPHFAVSLPDSKLLCYTVQGEHGFAFNLISNKKVYMNAMFVPDARREEVTWLGTMGIVINNSGYKKSNVTKLRFEAIKNKIHIDNHMSLDARNIEKLTFEGGKLKISEAPPIEGYKQPLVHIDLKDVELSFSIKFMTEHLDLYWHSTGQKLADSHGLIGQFFRQGVVLDDVRKILILPGKEPVPVQRKPLWAFMEREVTSDDSLCWVAMNPGYQGEGLIDGNYFDYLVDDVLSTEFKFKKL